MRADFSALRSLLLLLQSAAVCCTLGSHYLVLEKESRVEMVEEVDDNLFAVLGSASWIGLV